MTAILTPALALRHLRELSTDVRAAVALAPDGALLAGDAAIELPARALLAALGEQDATTLATSRGTVLHVRAPAGALVVVAGPHALLALLEHDLHMLLGDMRGVADAGSPAASEPADDVARLPVDAGAEADRALPADVAAAVDALIGAAQGSIEG